MNRSRGPSPLLCRMPLAFALCALVLVAPASHAQIAGTLSNFDARNNTQGPVTNLELDLRLIRPFDIVGTYHGPNAWGAPPVIEDIGGTEVTWAAFAQPLPPGGTRHFGLRLAPGAPVPCGVQAYWTRHLKIVEIPVPWQTWGPVPNGVVDVIRLNPDFPQAVMITREFARASVAVPLNELVWDNPGIVWNPVPTDPLILTPGGSLELEIPLTLADEAALVRYTVALAANPENILSRFVNEAEIEWLPTLQTPQIVGSLSNFDAHNDTGKPVHDLELDILNITPQDIVGWYNPPGAWGLNPLTRAPYIGTIPGGTEVTWVDEWNPIPNSQTRHFGLRLRPGAPEPFVRAFWTRTVKVWQIPVPWQWWVAPAPGVVRDVIQLSDTFDRPVVIQRQWATGPRIPLEDLTWDAPLLWNNDPEGPVALDPGDQTFLDIPVLTAAPAVYVRYTVSDPSGALLETRFINEAEIDPSAGSALQQIVGTLSNFDATNLTNVPVTNLELDIRTIQPHHILDWYRGSLAWGLHPVTGAPIISPLPQTEVTWVDFRNPLLPGEIRHFGVGLSNAAPVSCGVQAYWTRHLKVVEIPVPWQTWRPEPGALVDVIRLSPDFPQPVLLMREFAVVPFRLLLDDLNWDAPGIPWQPVTGDPFVLNPGAVAEIRIPILFPTAQAVLVRYSVGPLDTSGEIITRFVNQAEITITEAEQLPQIIGLLSNFDAINLTGKPVHDLELDILNIQPGDVLDWYRGFNSWGLDPVIGPIPGGTEITWVDDRNPMQPGEQRHFGVRLRPGTPEPLVRAFWTRRVKIAQIPVPWQFWMMPPGPFVRDVVQLSDTFVSPVEITREFAFVDQPVPLDDLNWDLAVNWRPESGGPRVLSPGFQADLDIRVPSREEGAVLVRYTVGAPGSTDISTRFTNELVLGPGVILGLTIGADKTTVSWNASPLGPTVYDLVRGPVSSLRPLGGIQAATCLQDNLPAPIAVDPTVPPTPDEGLYYLVRAESGTQHGTYDTTLDPIRREGRDAEIASGGGDCP